LRADGTENTRTSQNPAVGGNLVGHSTVRKNMEKFEHLAEAVRAELNLEYDAKSIKFIEEFIERQKTNLTIEDKKGLINSLGSFIGQTVIKNYGGQWQVDDSTQTECVAFDEQNKVFPFAKTTKQFENGLEDSVYSFFTMIPIVFKLNTLTSKKKTPKKWWKF